ncbi:hypothetical protein Hanom_Chr09g00857821 [Helianthus anomalus]
MNKFEACEEDERRAETISGTTAESSDDGVSMLNWVFITFFLADVKVFISSSVVSFGNLSNVDR